MKTGCSIAALLVFLALIALGFIVPVVVWDGAVAKSIVVTVVDAQSGNPLSGRTVVVLGIGGLQKLPELDASTRAEMIGRLREEGAVGVTDERGRTTVRAHLRAGGEDTFFLKRGRFAADGLLLILDDSTIVQETQLEALYPGTHSISKNLAPVILRVGAKK